MSQGITHIAVLQAVQQVPPTPSTASGLCALTYTSATRLLQWQCVHDTRGVTVARMYFFSCCFLLYVAFNYFFAQTKKN